MKSLESKMTAEANNFVDWTKPYSSWLYCFFITLHTHLNRFSERKKCKEEKNPLKDFDFFSLVLKHVDVGSPEESRFMTYFSFLLGKTAALQQLLLLWAGY